jgi:hypothetical protein
MPVPITGFQGKISTDYFFEYEIFSNNYITLIKEINKRFKLQDEENTSHKSSLMVVKDSIDGLNSRNKLIQSKIEQFKSRNEDLEQRVLKVKFCSIIFIDYLQYK